MLKITGFLIAGAPSTAIILKVDVEPFAPDVEYAPPLKFCKE